MAKDNFAVVTLGGNDIRSNWSPTPTVQVIPIGSVYKNCTLPNLPQSYYGNFATTVGNNSILACGGSTSNGKATNVCYSIQSGAWINTMNLTAKMYNFALIWFTVAQS
jgi:hypothetical protein